MPILKSAIKKMRKDKMRTKRNFKRKSNLKRIIKDAREKHTPKALKLAFSALDKAAKTNLIHKNKADRLKSRLSRSSNEGPQSAKTK